MIQPLRGRSGSDQQQFNGPVFKSFENVYYWRQASYEVDYVIEIGKRLFAIEVKSGRKRNSKGLQCFREEFKNATLIWITSDNIFEFLKDSKSFFEKM